MREIRPWMVALLLVGSAAAAETDSQRYLRAAVMLYDQLEYERALEVLQKARVAAGSLEDQVEVLLYEGILRAELGDQGAAAIAFTNALALDPKATLKVRVSPKVVDQFESARKSVARALRVDSPAAASVAAAPAAPEAQPALPVPAPEQSPSVSPTHSEVAVAPALRSSGARGLAWIPALAGVAFGGVGAGFAISAKVHDDRLKTETLPYDTAVVVRDEGNLHQAVGITGLALGGAALVAAGLMVIFGGPATDRVAVVPTATGAQLLLQAPLP